MSEIVRSFFQRGIFIIGNDYVRMYVTLVDLSWVVGRGRECSGRFVVGRGRECFSSETLFCVLLGMTFV